jgi:hypothetical protein
MLRLPLHLTHNLLRHNLTVFDVAYGRSALGVPTADQEADRIISGNLQPASDDVVALLPEGAQSEGAKVLHTTATIHMATNINGGEFERQTFLRHGGQLWKAWKLQDWSDHSPIGRWIFIRYVDVSGAIA